MPRREPPSQLKLIPWDVPTPPRGAPKYSLPCAPQPLLLPSRPARTRSYTLDSITPSSCDTPLDDQTGNLTAHKELVRGSTDSALASLSRITLTLAHGSQTSRLVQPDGMGERHRDRGGRVAPWLRTSRLAEDEVELALRGLTAPQGAVTAR